MNLELDINNKGYFKIPIPFTKLHIIFNDTLFATCAIAAILLVFSLIVSRKVKKWKDVPESKFQNILEFGVEMFHNFAVSNLGEKYAYFGNWFFGIFVFAVVSDMSALIKLRPPTADLAQTLAFAVTSWILIQYTGLTKLKGKYFKEFIEPVPLFLPIHIMGEIAPLISLSFRMFGNILGGFIIMELVYTFFPIWLKVGIPSALHMYFDLFEGSLQAFIFVMLSMTFIKNKTPHSE